MANTAHTKSTYHQSDCETIGLRPSLVSPASEVTQMEKCSVKRLLDCLTRDQSALVCVNLDSLQLQETVDPRNLSHAMK